MLFSRRCILLEDFPNKSLFVRSFFHCYLFLAPLPSTSDPRWNFVYPFFFPFAGFHRFIPGRQSSYFDQGKTEIVINPPLLENRLDKRRRLTEKALW